METFELSKSFRAKPKNKAEALRRVRAATNLKKAAKIAFEQSLVQASEIGCSLREIEAVADISNPRVYEIIKKNRDSKDPQKESTTRIHKGHP